MEACCLAPSFVALSREMRQGLHSRMAHRNCISDEGYESPIHPLTGTYAFAQAALAPASRSVSPGWTSSSRTRRSKSRRAKRTTRLSRPSVAHSSRSETSPMAPELRSAGLRRCGSVLEASRALPLCLQTSADVPSAACPPDATNDAVYEGAVVPRPM